ncbi:MAG: outer membrane beta-barrel protein, partial [Chitinophagales bacterium]
QSENFNETTQSRTFFNQNLPYSIDEKSEDKSHDINHRIDARLKYKIDDRNTLLIVPTLTIQQNEGISEGLTQTLSDNVVSNTLTNLFSSNLSGFNFSNRLVFVHRFENKKRLLNLQLRNSIRNSEGDNFTNATNFNVATSENAVLNQNSILDNRFQFYSVIARYTEPIGKKSTFTIGYTYENEFNEAEILTSTFNLVSENYDLIEENLSSQFNNDYQSQRGELTYNYRKEKLNLTLKGSYQSAILEHFQAFPQEAVIEKSFNNFLPKISLRYKISKSQNLRFSLRSRTRLPNARDLQNVIDNNNPLRISVGNPNLNQQRSHIFDLKYSANNPDKATVFFAYFRTSLYTDYIGRSTILAAKTDTINDIVIRKGAQFRQPINFSGYLNNRFFMTYGLPLSKWKSNFNVNFGVNHRRIPSSLDGVTFFTNSEKITTSFVLSSNISPELDFTLKTTSTFDFAQSDMAENTKIFNQKTHATINYIFSKHWQVNSNMTHRYFDTFGGEPIDDFILWNVSFGYKFLANNQAEIGLTLFDILNSNTTIQQYYNENSYTQKESLTLRQFIMVDFRYNIRDFG